MFATEDTIGEIRGYIKTPYRLIDTTFRRSVPWTVGISWTEKWWGKVFNPETWCIITVTYIAVVFITIQISMPLSCFSVGVSRYDKVNDLVQRAVCKTSELKRGQTPLPLFAFGLDIWLFAPRFYVPPQIRFLATLRTYFTSRSAEAERARNYLQLTLCIEYLLTYVYTYKNLCLGSKVH